MHLLREATLRSRVQYHDTLAGRGEKAPTRNNYYLPSLPAAGALPRSHSRALLSISLVVKSFHPVPRPAASYIFARRYMNSRE